MGRLVKDEKELAQAIKNNVDYIEVEGGIKYFFIKVKGTGKIAWTLCIGCLAIAAATTAYMVTKEDGDIKKWIEEDLLKKQQLQLYLQLQLPVYLGQQQLQHA